MWTFHITTGLIEHNGTPVEYGWSGFEDGINVVAMESIPMIGPLPRGKYVITGPPFTDPRMGPYVLRLIPAPGNATPRTGFCWHGFSVAKPFDSSEGCLVSLEWVRQKAWESGDRDLESVA